MVIRKCNDTAYRYGEKLLTAYYRDGILCINQLRLNIGDKVCFVIEDKIYEGYITDFEKSWNDESYSEISEIFVDNESFSIYDILWIGVE